jgi:hypothetical protein
MYMLVNILAIFILVLVYVFIVNKKEMFLNKLWNSQLDKSIDCEKNKKDIYRKDFKNLVNVTELMTGECEEFYPPHNFY